MEERERIRRTPSERTSEEVEEPVRADEAAGAQSGERIKAELDDLLDEIDEVLETNAEEFVRSFVQKGGE